MRPAREARRHAIADVLCSHFAAARRPAQRNFGREGRGNGNEDNASGRPDPLLINAEVAKVPPARRLLSTGHLPHVAEGALIRRARLAPRALAALFAADAASK